MIVFCQNCDTEPLEMNPADTAMLMTFYRPLCIHCSRDRGHAFDIWCQSQLRAAPELQKQGRMWISDEEFRAACGPELVERLQ